MTEKEEIKFILDNILPNRESGDEETFAETFRQLTDEQRSKFREDFQSSLDYSLEHPRSDELSLKMEKVREIAKKYLYD